MTITKEQRVPRGRPKIHNFESKQEYFRNYYKKNRDKWNYDYLCDACQLYCSFANKSRHVRSKFHLQKAMEKDAMCGLTEKDAMSGLAEKDALGGLTEKDAMSGLTEPSDHPIFTIGKTDDVQLFAIIKAHDV